MPALPIIHSKHYDIGFFGLEKRHPFDTRQYGRVIAYSIEHLLRTELAKHSGPGSR